VIQLTVHGILAAMALGIKWPGRDASSVKINSAWNYTCTPLYVFMVLCSDKHGNYCTVHSESHCARRLQYVDLVVSIEVAIEMCCCFTVFSC
jgi:hypothetical protein